MAAKTLTVILAGGVGSRLHPLTEDRAKPAVPFGGKYRIIDFTLSNCLHSGLRRILVLTQYKSHSLQKHLRDSWSVFNPGIGEYITVVPPQMRTGDSWYRGTADAVFQNVYLLRRSGAERVLVLSGDHIYRMDYAAMLESHDLHQADATVGCMRVPRSEASQFGVMAVDANDRIVEFQEKPAAPTPLPDDPENCLVSMGIYVFSCDLLCQLLEEDAQLAESAHDFGKDVIPNLLERHRVFGYPFGDDRGRVSRDGYWRDVGTIDAYFEANMDLLRRDPPIDLYQRDWQICGTDSSSPPARTVPGRDGVNATIRNAMLGAGTVVCGATVQHSVLSQDVQVREGAEIRRSILFDGVQVGEGAQLEDCIVDKHVVIPPGAVIGKDIEADRRRFTISAGGVTVVPRGYRFPPVAPTAMAETCCATSSPLPSVESAGRLSPSSRPR